jgi:ferredoxin
MEVILDESLCDGHGLCAETAPEVFDLRDEDDVATVLEQSPGEEQRKHVAKAALLCPKGAIRIVG